MCKHVCIAGSYLPGVRTVDETNAFRHQVIIRLGREEIFTPNHGELLNSVATMSSLASEDGVDSLSFPYPPSGDWQMIGILRMKSVKFHPQLNVRAFMETWEPLLRT